MGFNNPVATPGQEGQRPVASFNLRRTRIAATLLVCLAATMPAAANPVTPEFRAWLEAFKQEALSKGISRATVTTALAGVEPIERVLELDRRQPEFALNLAHYLNNAVGPERIRRGRELLERHRPLLTKIQRRYGIQPRFLVAFWGMESNFGEFTGGFPVIGGLTTLAYDKRRGAFFREQLLHALKILDEGHVTAAAMTGSWAGGMGPLQLIPTTFTGFALDYDRDGRRDIWNSLPDMFGSAANFLRARGWQPGQSWGTEVRLPGAFAWELAGLDIQKPVKAWRDMGIRTMDGGNLADGDTMASIILPAGYRGPAFMVYPNFHTIMDWNRSSLYAVALGHLADRIAGAGPLLGSLPVENQGLSLAEVKAIQHLLAALGFYRGTPDGIPGTGTQRALKAFQVKRGIPADGYPTRIMLRSLREAAGY
jgi:membrane-bound lytic murein transglycosylase B